MHEKASHSSVNVFPKIDLVTIIGEIILHTAAGENLVWTGIR